MEGSAGNDYNDARQESADVEAVGDTVNVDASVLDDAVNKNKYKRSKHKCPFPTCKSVVTHLPRHMRLSHGWSAQDAQNVVSKFGLRKSRSKSSKKTLQKGEDICMSSIGMSVNYQENT